MYMNDEQIQKDYRRAADKRDAICVLAKINRVTAAKMREHLFLLGEDLPPRNREADKTRFPDLYRQRLSDHEIAKVTGASRSVVCQWRRENGLPPNTHKRIDYEPVQAYYRQGLNDRQIADILDVSVSAVCKWRRRNGLPKNDTRRRRRRHG